MCVIKVSVLFQSNGHNSKNIGALYSVFVKTWGKETGNPQKGYEMILASQDHILIFVIGNVVAFVVAWIAIKSFIALLNKYGFRPWGWYRIFVGIALLVYFYWFK